MKGFLLTRECGMTMVWGDPAEYEAPAPGKPLRVRQCAVSGLPGSGTPGELMEAAGISASRIAAAARDLRYTAELEQPGPREALSRLRDLAAGKPVTLLTATRDLDLSQVAVLAGLLHETP